MSVEWFEQVFAILTDATSRHAGGGSTNVPPATDNILRGPPRCWLPARGSGLDGVMSSDPVRTVRTCPRVGPRRPHRPRRLRPGLHPHGRRADARGARRPRRCCRGGPAPTWWPTWRSTGSPSPACSTGWCTTSRWRCTSPTSSATPQIEELAEAEPSELRERHLAATTAFADAVEAMQRRALDGPHRPAPRGTLLARGDRRTDEAA